MFFGCLWKVPIGSIWRCVAILRIILMRKKNRIEAAQPDFSKKTGWAASTRIVWTKNRVDLTQPTWLTRFWQTLCCQDIRIDWKGGRWGSGHPRLIIWGLLTRGNPGIVTIPQYRVNKTKQHTYTCRKPNQPTPILFNVSAYFRKKMILGPKFEIPSKKILADILRT